MLSLAILGILAFGTYLGFKRGFAKQAVSTFGFIIAFVVAKIFYGAVSQTISEFIPYPSNSYTDGFSSLFSGIDLESAFFNAMAFILIFIVVKIVLNIVATVFNVVAKLPLLNGINRVFGAALGFVEYYITTFFALIFAALIPSDTIQTAISNSPIAEWMITNTPILSNLIAKL